MSKQRHIGTAAESAVVRYLREFFPEADRSPLRGNRDQGDIRGTGAIIWEVKAGEAARGNAATGEVPQSLLSAWLFQTEIERRNAGVRFGILVTVRRGVGASNCHRWYAWLPAWQLADMLGTGLHQTDNYPVRMEMQHLMLMLGACGLLPDVEAFADAAGL